MILVTGGCGFIGSNFVLDWIQNTKESIVVLDKLTYAGHISNLNSVINNPLFTFIKGDITNEALVEFITNQFKPRAILNFAAESHVDRSIQQPNDFITTNINGTFCLLEVAKKYWYQLNELDQKQFRFIQISTDEVYGSLNENDPPFKENSPYSPNNPYSASKAAADHLVKSYYHTFGLPTLITNCSNNFGPYQFPEKLIPITILNALENKPICIYGDGLQVRDWLFVTDHCSALRKILTDAPPGEAYNIGGNNEKTNLQVVNIICELMDDLIPSKSIPQYSSLITHIKDRPGHDRRYAIDATKLKEELNWTTSIKFEKCLQKTILWYLENSTWLNTIKQTSDYKDWLKLHYNNRVTQ